MTFNVERSNFEIIFEWENLEKANRKACGQEDEEVGENVKMIRILTIEIHFFN